MSEPTEKSGPPPQYEVPPYEPPQPTENPNTQTRSNVIPVFITARTSVYGVNPVEMDCPQCNAHIVTHIEHIAGTLAWIIFGVCFLAGFFLLGLPWCFCCIPFCADTCLDVVHECPACKRLLGRYNRM